MSQKDPKGFWNKRAKTFPRYSPDENGYEVCMLNLAKKHGAVFKEKRILDVGCGSGMYTIRLAMEAEKVAALDIAKEMLEVLKNDAEALGLSNVEYINSDWLGFKGGENYDLIFCSMTPALGNDEGREKVASYSGATVVYMGWNGGMNSSVMSGLYEHYRVTPQVFNNVPDMRQWLDGRGIKYEFLPVEGQWRVPFAKDDLADKCVNMLENFDVEADGKHIDEYLEQFRQDDGFYLEITDYKVAMIIWQNI